MGVHGHKTAGVEVDPKLSFMFDKRNTVTPYSCLRLGRGIVRGTVRGAEKRVWKKRMPIP